MIQIYGVKVTESGKERRYYGDCETAEEAAKAIEIVLITNSYAYGKEIGVGTVIYRERPEYKYGEHKFDHSSSS